MTTLKNMVSNFERMPTGEETCECCDCESREHRREEPHRTDPDWCGECHFCFKPLP